MQRMRSGNAERMAVLIVLFILVFLLLLASMPLIVEARARAGLRGAVVHGKLFLLGLMPIPIRLRIRFFSAPYFTLQYRKKNLFLLKKRRKKRGKRPIFGVRILRLDARVTVGIDGEPAQAVLTSGSLAVALSMLIPRIAEGGSAKAVLSKYPMLRLSIGLKAIVSPMELLFGILRDRRIAKRKAANNIGESKEKRTTYASC